MRYSESISWQRTFAALVAGIVVVLAPIFALETTAAASSLPFSTQTRNINGVLVRVTPVGVSNRTTTFTVVLSSQGADIGKGNEQSSCKSAEIPGASSHVTSCAWHTDATDDEVGKISIASNRNGNNDLQLKFNEGSGRFDCRWPPNGFPPGAP